MPGNSLFNGTRWEHTRGPNVVKTATATGAGDTALWTPATGKRFRLMRFQIQVPANAAAATAAAIDVLLRDGTTATGLGLTVFVPATADVATLYHAGTVTGWIDLGNGVISGAVDRVLNINLSAALTAGKVRVVACGTEE